MYNMLHQTNEKHFKGTQSFVLGYINVPLLCFIHDLTTAMHITCIGDLFIGYP